MKTIEESYKELISTQKEHIRALKRQIELLNRMIDLNYEIFEAKLSTNLTKLAKV